MDTFECLFENLESQDIEVNILGDSNCDIGDCPADHNSCRLLETSYYYSSIFDQWCYKMFSIWYLINAIRKLPSFKSNPKIKNIKAI